MANQSNLAEWLLVQKDRIDFKITEYTWVEDYAPEYSDFGVVFGNEIFGRAIDKNPETSLTKAIAEAIERATCVHNGLSQSTGVAAHPNEVHAFLNAKRELIERISFDFHFSKRRPFKKFQPSTEEAQKAADLLSKVGIQLSFFELISPDNFTVICAVALGENCKRPFGGIFGFSCNEDHADAERAALFESLRNAAFYTQDQDTIGLSIDDFRKIPSPKFFDRFRLALDASYFQQVSFLFFERTLISDIFPSLLLTHQELQKPPEFSEAPLTVMRVTSDYVFDSAKSALPSFMD
jgi:hypothetical protein